MQYFFVQNPIWKTSIYRRICSSERELKLSSTIIDLVYNHGDNISLKISKILSYMSVHLQNTGLVPMLCRCFLADISLP